MSALGNKPLCGCTADSPWSGSFSLVVVPHRFLPQASVEVDSLKFSEQLLHTGLWELKQAATDVISGLKKPELEAELFKYMAKAGAESQTSAHFAECRLQNHPSGTRRAVVQSSAPSSLQQQSHSRWNWAVAKAGAHCWRAVLAGCCALCSVLSCLLCSVSVSEWACGLLTWVWMSRLVTAGKVSCGQQPRIRLIGLILVSCLVMSCLGSLRGSGAFGILWPSGI